MAVTAREMIDGRVCLQLRLTSQLPSAVVLLEASLSLQPGFFLAADIARAAGLLPCEVRVLHTASICCT